MKKIILILILFLVACTKQVEPSKVEARFKVGVIIPLTGQLAAYGQAVVNGIELVKKEKPELFKKIEFYYQDSKYNSKTAVSAFRSLEEKHRINLYHVWGVSPNESLIPILESRKIPAVVETTLKDSIINKKYIIRAATTGENIADLLVNELVKRKVKSLGVISVQIPYYEDIVKYLAIAAQDKDIDYEVIANHLTDVTDFKLDLLKLNKNKPDSLALFLLPNQYLPFYRQALSYNLPKHIFGAGIPNSQELINSLPENVNGLFMATLGKLNKFRPRYLAEYQNDEFIGAAAQSYDFGLLVGLNFNTDDSYKLDSQQIIDRLKTDQSIEGVTGNFSFEQTDSEGMHFDMPISLRAVVNKKITDLE